MVIWVPKKCHAQSCGALSGGMLCMPVGVGSTACSKLCGDFMAE